MNHLRPLPVLAALALLLATCKPDSPPRPLQDRFYNEGAEAGTGLPDYWYYSEGDSLAAGAALWSGAAYEGTRCLKLSRTTEDPMHEYWGQTFAQVYRRNKAMVLRVFIKTEAVTGHGVALMLRGDDAFEARGEAEAFATTQGQILIAGTQDWTEYSLRLPDGFDGQIQSVSLYLVLLPEATGTVYFDQVSLTEE
ncbi:MAG: hypothetical protein OHK0039_09610 [Bacteroidia bacterium]